MKFKILVSIIITFILFLPRSSIAGTVTQDTVYSTGSSVTATNFNANLAVPINELNGNLDNDNADTSNGFRFYEIKSSLPAAGTQGRSVYRTSDDTLHFDTGSAFEQQAVTSRIKDNDNDTQVQCEESSDEDIIRFDNAGTEMMVLQKGTTAVTLDLLGTQNTSGNVFDIGDADALTTGSIINAASNSADTGTRTLFVLKNDNTAATGTTNAILQNDSSGDTLSLDHNTTELVSGKHVFLVNSDAANTNADTAVFKLVQDNASAQEPGLEIDHDGVGGAAIEIDKDGSSATDDMIGILINADNADTGEQVGIQFTLVDEGKSYAMTFTNNPTAWSSSKAPQTVAPDGWIQVRFGASTDRFIPVYAGS